MLRVASPSLAKFIAAAADRVMLLAYDPSEQKLSVPLGCELPSVLARSVILCSGRPPIMTNNGLVYQNVPELVAQALSSSLRAPADTIR